MTVLHHGIPQEWRDLRSLLQRRRQKIEGRPGRGQVPQGVSVYQGGDVRGLREVSLPPANDFAGLVPKVYRDRPSRRLVVVMVPAKNRAWFIGHPNINLLGERWRYPAMPRPQGRWDGALYSRSDVRAILKGLLGHDGLVTSLTLARFLQKAGLPCDSKAIWRATVVLEDGGLLAPDVKWDCERDGPLRATLARKGGRGPWGIMEWWRRRFPVSRWYRLPTRGAQVIGAGSRRHGARVRRSRGLTVGDRGIRRTRKDEGPSGEIRRSPAWLVKHYLRWGMARLLVPVEESQVVEVRVRVLPPVPPESGRGQREAWKEEWLGRLVQFDAALHELRGLLQGVTTPEAVEATWEAWLDGSPGDLPLRVEETRPVRFVEDSVTTYRFLGGLEDLIAGEA